MTVVVLIIAEPSDATADHVEAAVTAQGGQVFRFDTGEFPQRLRLDTALENAGWRGTLTSATGSVALEDVGSVYVRRSSSFELPSHLTSAERRHAGLEARYGLGGVLASLRVRWCNHPARSADAAYKPGQLLDFTSCGLAVPQTRITTSADAVRRFAGEVGHVICKSIASGVVHTSSGSHCVYTQLMTDESLADLRGLEYAPHLFQEFVSKAFEVRLTVVAGRFFGVKITAGSARALLDWRSDYESLGYEIIDTPRDVRAGVTAYLRMAGLTFGAFDFVVQPNGSWVALECNPEGQWEWLAEETGLPIAEAIASFLLKGSA